MRKALGNCLIILSLALFLYIYYPLLMAYIPIPTSEVYAQNSGSYISVPKINAQAVIIENVDSGNKAEYQKALEHGVAEAGGFAKPGEGKLVYLFAHSSLPPWEMTRTNTAFLRINELQNGDQIVISAPCHPESSEGSQDSKKSKDSSPSVQNDKCEYKYQVFDKKEYWPNQTEVFTDKRDQNLLILQTCTPIGTDLKRLLVFAKPI